MRNYLCLLSLFTGSLIAYAQKQEEKPFTSAFTVISSGKTDKPSDWIVVYAEDGLMGYLNSQGKEIVPPLYENIHPFGEYKENWARVEILGGLTGFIDSTGKTVVEPKYEYIEKFGTYKADWALVSVNDKYGFINTKGEEVVAPIYAEIPILKR